jgi:hypothetical protein
LWAAPEDISAVRAGATVVSFSANRSFRKNPNHAAIN